MARIYVASSWRNPIQPEVVAFLRQEGHEVYDYRNPKPGNTGFGWSRIDPNWLNWTAVQFREALKHPLAEEGYELDSKAMEWADECCLVLPCGNSAHIEAGWESGKMKRTSLFWHEDYNMADLYKKVEPELMVKLFEKVDPDYFCVNYDELRQFHAKYKY